MGTQVVDCEPNPRIFEGKVGVEHLGIRRDFNLVAKKLAAA